MCSLKQMHTLRCLVHGAPDDLNLCSIRGSQCTQYKHKRIKLYLKLTGMHPVVALYERIAKIVYAKFLQAFQC